jgi:tetratricopeptide (TPR) repeat protein
MDFAERAAPALIGRDQLAWLDRLEQEHDNLRLAVAWSLATAPEVASRLVAAIWPFCQRRSHYAEWAAWVELLRPPDGQLVPRSQAWAEILLGASRLAFERGDRVEARTQAEASVHVARHVGGGAERVLVLGLREVGRVLIDSSEMAQAEVALGEALALSRTIGDEYVIGLVLATQGMAALHQNAYVQARALLEQGLACLQRAGADRFSMVPPQAFLGRVYREQGDFDRAELATAASLAMAREVGSTWETSVILSHLGYVSLYRGDLGQAAAFGNEAVALARACGSVEALANSLALVGMVVRAEGDVGRAVRVLEDAIVLLRARGQQRAIADALRGLGTALYDAGNIDEAARRLREGLALAVSLGDRILMAGFLEGLARAEVVVGDAVRAAKWLATAAAQRAALGAPLPPVETPTGRCHVNSRPDRAWRRRIFGRLGCW